MHIAPSPGAELRRLEGLPEHARYLVQSPITERPHFVFSLDEGGSERYVQYRFDLGSGTYQALTPVAARSYVGGFDGDGRRVLYASARRNRKDLDLYVVGVLNPASDALVFQADGQFSAEAFSPDGRKALVARITAGRLHRAHRRASTRAVGRPRVTLPPARSSSRSRRPGVPTAFACRS